MSFPVTGTVVDEMIKPHQPLCCFNSLFWGQCRRQFHFYFPLKCVDAVSSAHFPALDSQSKLCRKFTLFIVLIFIYLFYHVYVFIFLFNFFQYYIKFVFFSCVDMLSNVINVSLKNYYLKQYKRLQYMRTQMNILIHVSVIGTSLFYVAANLPYTCCNLTFTSDLFKCGFSHHICPI